MADPMKDPERVWVVLHPDGTPTEVPSTTADCHPALVKAYKRNRYRRTEYVSLAAHEAALADAIREASAPHNAELAEITARLEAIQQRTESARVAELESSLAAQEKRIVELEAELTALRIEHAKCPTCTHGIPLDEVCYRCGDVP